MYCENCGHKLPYGAVFCPNCGHNVKQNFSSKLIDFKNKWNRIPIGKKAIPILLICIIGLIYGNFFAIGSLMSADSEPADTYEDNYTDVYYDDSDDDEAYTSLIEDNPATTESYYSSDSSSDYSQSQDTSDSYESYSYSGSYVGSVNSDKFHYPSCGHAGRIKPGNLITFSSREDAISSGYTPCKSCSP